METQVVQVAGELNQPTVFTAPLIPGVANKPGGILSSNPTQPPPPLRVVGSTIASPSEGMLNPNPTGKGHQSFHRSFLLTMLIRFTGKWVFQQREQLFGEQSDYGGNRKCSVDVQW